MFAKLFNYILKIPSAISGSLNPPANLIRIKAAFWLAFIGSKKIIARICGTEHLFFLKFYPLGRN